MPHKTTKNHRRPGKTGKTTRHKNKRSSRRAPTHSQPRALAQLRTQTPLFPATTTKRLPYYESAINLNGTAGVITQYAFTANGVYDPNVTGTGHQPLGFDTMMLYYEQYTVIRSRITIRFAGNGAQPVNISLCLAPDTTSLSLPMVVENGLIVTKLVDGRGNGGYGTGNRISSLNLACDVSRYFGRRGRALINDPNLSGTVAANPVEQVYFIINTWGFSTFTDNTSVSLDVIIEYDVVFWEPRKLAEQLRRADSELKDFHSINAPPPACRSCKH
jgi:hypothetical protein